MARSPCGRGEREAASGPAEGGSGERRHSGLSAKVPPHAEDRLHERPACFVPRQARDEEAQHEGRALVASPRTLNLILSLSKDEAAAPAAALRPAATGTASRSACR